MVAAAAAVGAALEGQPVNVYKMKCFVGEPRDCYGNWVFLAIVLRFPEAVEGVLKEGRSRSILSPFFILCLSLGTF